MKSNDKIGDLTGEGNVESVASLNHDVTNSDMGDNT
jgi:hypothetical protein